MENQGTTTIIPLTSTEGVILRNLHPTDDADIPHELDFERFKQRRANDAKEYIEYLRLRGEVKTESSSFVSMYLNDMFDQQIMLPIIDQHKREIEQNIEKRNLVKDIEGNEAKKAALRKYNAEHPKLFYDMIDSSIRTELYRAEDRGSLFESESVQDMITTVTDGILCNGLFEFDTNIRFSKYIRSLTGMSFIRDEMKSIIRDAFALSVEETIKNSNDHINIEAIMSPSRLEDVIRSNTIKVITHKYNQALNEFNRKLDEYSKSREYGHITFTRVIEHFVGIKLLRLQDAHTFAKEVSVQEILKVKDSNSNDHYIRYLSETLRMQAVHNLDYDFNLPEITFRYQYTVTAHENAREGIRKIRRRGVDTEIYDFLQLYKNIKLDTTIKWMVHKEREMVRIRTNLSIDETNTDEYPEHFSVYFDGKAIADFNDTPMVSFDDCTASFDLYTSKCYLIGTSEQIEWMIRFFDQYSYRLENPVFKSFKGSMNVISKAVYSKRIFQTLLRYELFSKYWLTKGTTASNNNFQFIFKEQNNPIINTNEYVQLNIVHTSKLSMLDNEWKFSFEGNRHDYVVPFIAMLLSMIHFTSNLIFNEKFKKYVQYEREILRFYTDKTSRNNTRKSTDISLISVAHRMITKKDVYNDSIALIPRTKEELNAYTGRSKPLLIHYFTEDDTETMEKWRKFFYEAAKKENKLLVRRTTPQNNIRNCSVEFTSDKILLYVYKSDGSRNINEIGARYPSADGSQVYWITYYPEKSNVYTIVHHSNMWLRHAAISEKNQSAYRSFQSVRLRVQIPAQTENVVKHFTEEPIKKISFFEPYNLNVDEKPLEHLKKFYGDESVIIALCKQHLWDHSDEEILTSINDFDMKKHHELIQNYTQSTILYFEYNDHERKYELMFPRHKYWYSYNYHYGRVMFVFKTMRSKYEVIYFGDINGSTRVDKMSFRCLDVSKLSSYDRIMDFVKIFNLTTATGYLKKNEDLAEKLDDDDVPDCDECMLKETRDITYDRLMVDIPRGWKLDGQMFDSNGKSVGIRLCKGRSVVDLRFSPQFVIMPSKNFYALRAVNDSRTNIDPSEFEGDVLNYCQIIPRRTTCVKYDIVSLAAQYEKRRQMLYWLSRMIITHWMLNRFFSNYEELVDNEHEEFVDEEGEDMIVHDQEDSLEDYLTRYINAYAQPLVEHQRIESVVIPMYFEDKEKLEEYLADIMPNFFHGLSFRVAPSDVEPFRAYMRRELEILVNMNKEFYTSFANARMHTILSVTDSDEIVDMKNIQELQTIHNIKKHLVDQKNYLFSSYFDQNFDIKTKTLKENAKSVLSDKLVISKNTTTKTELLITKVNGRYYMIRFTNNGEMETAVYICNYWAKHKKICSFWETESMLGSKRMFEVDVEREGESLRNMIVESPSNNQSELALGDQDFHILRYKRDTKIAFAAMLPFE